MVYLATRVTIELPVQLDLPVRGRKFDRNSAPNTKRTRLAGRYTRWAGLSEASPGLGARLLCRLASYWDFGTLPGAFRY